MTLWYAKIEFDGALLLNIIAPIPVVADAVKEILTRIEPIPQSFLHIEIRLA